jgi:hypothetical protein
MTTPLTRRQCLRWWPAAAGLAWIGTLGGCAGITGPRVITLGERDLNTLVGRAFPLQRRVLDLLEVEAAAPRVRLLPERNRLAVDVGLTVRDRLSGRRQAGQLAFDSALRYDAADPSVRLLQVSVAAITLDPPIGAGPGTGPDSLAWRVGRVLAERMLEDLPVWRPGAERLAQMQASALVPGAVTVTARGVEITLANR